MIIALLWDFDGVVVNTPHEKAWRITAENYGIRDFTSDFYYKYVSGRPREEGARAILEYYGLLRGLSRNDAERLVKSFSEEKNRVFNELICRGDYSLNHDVVEFIKMSKSLEKPRFIHILASASKNVAKLARNLVVEGTPLAKFFDVDVSGLAPSKKGVFKLGRDYVKADCYIAVDDAPSGILAAKELFIIPVGYRHRSLLDYGARIVIESFENIKPEVFQELCT